MTTAARGDRHEDDVELAAAVHQVLAILTDVRPSVATADRLRDRIELTRWLRGELDAVDALLTSTYDRRGRRPAVSG